MYWTYFLADITFKKTTIIWNFMLLFLLNFCFNSNIWFRVRFFVSRFVPSRSEALRKMQIHVKQIFRNFPNEAYHIAIRTLIRFLSIVNAQVLIQVEYIFKDLNNNVLRIWKCQFNKLWVGIKTLLQIWHCLLFSLLLLGGLEILQFNNY